MYMTRNSHNYLWKLNLLWITAEAAFYDRSVWIFGVGIRLRKGSVPLLFDSKLLPSRFPNLRVLNLFVGVPYCIASAASRPHSHLFCQPFHTHSRLHTHPFSKQIAILS